MDVIAQKVHTKCAKLVDENNSLTVLLSKCSIESCCFSYEERYTNCLSKKQKKVHVNVLLFILYSIWVHVESLKYKMICLKSPKSCEFPFF